MSRSELAARTVLVLAIVLAPVLFWLMFDVILVAVAAVLFALLLRMGAELFTRWFGLSERLALLMSGLLAIAVVGGAAYLFGARVGAQMSDVAKRAEESEHAIVQELQSSSVGRLLMSHMTGQNFSLTSIVGAVFLRGAGLAEAVIAAAIAGAYMAANPDVYRDGLVQLFPKGRRAGASETVDALEKALRLWLMGQMIQMAIIGLCSGVAVWLIGLPSPFALGLIAGLAEFVPYVGPIIAAIPALLVAATKSYVAVAWTIAAYLIIHQTEGNVLAPIVQRHMLSIPPGVVLLGIVTVSFMFGVAGMIFAAPLSVIAFVLIKKAYVRDALGADTPLPGD